MSLKYNINGEIPEVRLRLGLYITDDQWQQQNAIGFRFETPESEGEGTHNYYHAQMFHSFNNGSGSGSVFSKHTWLPVTQPAFALDAGNPLELLACMLTSLYGPDYVIRTIIAPHSQLIKNHLKDIVCLRRPTAPIIMSHRSNQKVSRLTDVEVRTPKNPIGSTIARTDISLHRHSDNTFWNGHEWIDTKYAMRSTSSGEMWKCSIPAGKVTSGSYSLRAVVYDDSGGFNSSSIEVEVQ